MAGTSGVSVRIVVRRSDVPQYRAAVDAGLRRIVASRGFDVEARAKQLVPVLTGTLRRSIHTVLSESGLRATIGPSVRYGVHIEYGTRHMAARPYMRPAHALIAPRVVDDVRRLLRGAV